MQIHKRLNRSLLSLVLILTLSCSHHGVTDFFGKVGSRIFANNPTDMDRIKYLLAADRFQHYISVFANHFDNKVSDEIVDSLRAIRLEDVLAADIPYNNLNDPNKFDSMIHSLLTQRYPSLEFNPSELKWNYNFLKRKLGEGYSIKETKIKPGNTFTEFDPKPNPRTALAPTGVRNENLTLEAEQYISDRMTRAVFIESVEANRPVEFHIGDSREFVKNVSSRNGEVIAEIDPFAKNYNKIYVVKYPDEDHYRYAISNIGGFDRLEHLIHHFSISALDGAPVNNKIEIFGDIEEFHKAMTYKFESMLQHLPEADRVVIGQKRAIEKRFHLLWKIRALGNLYDEDAALVTSKLEAKQMEALQSVFEDGHDVDLAKNKKAVEDIYKIFEPTFKEKPELLPERFLDYNFDNSTIEMSDVVFKNKVGKETRWRLVSNVWGDEVVPLAKALKNTGHSKVDYIGTAGAVPDKGYKVGDLVAPEFVQIDNQTLRVRGSLLDVEGMKIAGAVDHVGSPFEETYEWLDRVKQRSDFVEIETSYLRNIFNGSGDDLRIYLLISDILGSEGESLASDNSNRSARAKNLSRLLEALMGRDKVGVPTNAVTDSSNNVLKLKKAIEKVIGNKGKVYQRYVFAELFSNGQFTEQAVKNFTDSADAFSDNYFSTRMVQASEALSLVLRDIDQDLPIPKVGIDKEFINGKFHPKKDKVKIALYATSDEMAQQYQARIDKYGTAVNKIKNWATIEVLRGPPAEDMSSVRIHNSIDRDFLINLYSHAGLRQGGLDYNITYNGNITYDILPTAKTSEVCNVTTRFCKLAYYGPDQRTKELSEGLTNFNSNNFKQMLNDVIEETNGFLDDHGEDETFKAFVKKTIVDDLPEGRLAELVPEYDAQKGLIINLKLTQEGYNNPVVVLEEMAHLRQIISDGSSYTSDGWFGHPLNWASMTLNAENGSKRSQLFLAKAEVDVIDVMRDLLHNKGLYDEAAEEYLQARQAHAEQIVKGIKKEVRVENRARKAIGLQWKELQKALESQTDKLDDFIARNDRVNVRKLIDSFMPWEQMEPTQIAAWRRWLDAIEKPAANIADADKVLLFRGLEGDLVRESTDGGYFLMSKLLTKNQGNYTRRLRSLKTYRKKLAAVSDNIVQDEVDSVLNVFKGHSHEPVGSPFLSTSILDVAESFEGWGEKKGMSAIYISKDRILNNLVSDYDSEVERLVPMIIFPDELIHVEQNEAYNGADEFVQKLEQKLGRSVTVAEKSGRDMGALESTKQWWDFIQPNNLQGQGGNGNACSQIIEFFGN